MLFSDFKEANQAEIELKDIKWDQFYHLLEQIYGVSSMFDDDNVYYLLELADLFECPKVVDNCEYFLQNSEDSEMEESDKLELADKYGMVNTVKHLVDNLEEDDIHQIMEYDLYKGFQHSTKDALLKRAMPIIKKLKESN